MPKRLNWNFHFLESSSAPIIHDPGSTWGFLFPDWVIHSRNLLFHLVEVMIYTHAAMPAGENC